MPDQRSAAEIEDAATDWVAKVERGLTPDERATLDEWLEENSRHLGAFVRAQAAWIHAERAVALGAMPEAEPEPEQIAQENPSAELAADTEDVDNSRKVNRRALLAGGGALAASIAGAGFFLLDQSRTIESGVGEVRHLALAGGTTLTLDTDTRVEIADGSNDRKLKLAQGKLFLDVASRGPGSLIVEAGGLVMEMIEGSFAVQSLMGTPLVTLVTKGTLSVSQGGGLFSRKRSLTVGSDQVFTLPAGADLISGHVGAMAREQQDQFLAWRDGMLAFGGEALSTAVRAFDRYGSTRIVVTDPELAEQKITGLFKADDPKGFAIAIAASFGALVTQQGNNLRISRKNLSGA